MLDSLHIRTIARKTDLFPENDSPGCELREPERPIDAPYAVDIPAVPTALGALDAALTREFWAALAAYRFTPEPEAANAFWMRSARHSRPCGAPTTGAKRACGKT